MKQSLVHRAEGSGFRVWPLGDENHAGARTLVLLETVPIVKRLGLARL